MNGITELMSAVPSRVEALPKARPHAADGQFQAALERAREAFQRQETPPNDAADEEPIAAAEEGRDERGTFPERLRARAGDSSDASDQVEDESPANGAAEAEAGGQSAVHIVAAPSAPAVSEPPPVAPPVDGEGSASLESGAARAAATERSFGPLQANERLVRSEGEQHGEPARSEAARPAPRPQAEAGVVERIRSALAQPDAERGALEGETKARALFQRAPRGERARLAAEQNAAGRETPREGALAPRGGASPEGPLGGSLPGAGREELRLGAGPGSQEAELPDEAPAGLKLVPSATEPRGELGGAQRGPEPPVEGGSEARTSNEGGAAAPRDPAPGVLPEETASKGEVEAVSRSLTRSEPAFEGARFASLARAPLQQMVRSAEAQIGEEVSTLRLQLKPANLGELDLRLSVEHGVLTAKFVAQSLEVKALIESALPDLRQSLNQQGVAVEQLTVSVGDPDGGRSGGYDRESRPERSRGLGPRSGNPVEAVGAGAQGGSPRMWYSQGVDVLV